jgi:hypothetical protein
MLTKKTRPATPRFTGVGTFSDIDNRFQFRYPTDWTRFDVDNKRGGVIFSPYGDEAEPKTFVTGYADDLDFKVVAEDMADLSLAVDEGLKQMNMASLELSTDTAFGNLLKFERVFTFREGDALRKRRIWIMYVDRFLIVLAYQGESVEDYDFWLPMGNTMFYHMKIPDSFWFATDRDLGGAGIDQSSKPGDDASTAKT